MIRSLALFWVGTMSLFTPNECLSLSVSLGKIKIKIKIKIPMRKLSQKLIGSAVWHFKPAAESTTTGYSKFFPHSPFGKPTADSFPLWKHRRFPNRSGLRSLAFSMGFRRVGDLKRVSEGFSFWNFLPFYWFLFSLTDRRHVDGSSESVDRRCYDWPYIRSFFASS